jgi:N-acetylmuramoyl-L-alanine amidase
MNNSIRGIVIDPGHGGDDPCASGNGIIEKDYTLLISKYMYDRLKQLGIPVILTRDSDITLTPTERVNRVKNAFGNYKDVLVISNHINAGGADISYCEWLN